MLPLSSSKRRCRITTYTLETTGRQPYYLTVGVEYVVGRKNCAILLQSDQSISRVHAYLTVNSPAASQSQASTTPTLTLKDTSKYGTFVNEERLQNDTQRLLQPGDRPYYLTVGVEYVVGRKNCAILLQSDQSISRVHAYLTVNSPAASQSQASTTPTLTLKDTSKYGTFVNEERLQNDTQRLLQPGDRVTFGVFHSKFRVEYKSLIVCSSCLDGQGRIALTQSVQQLGGCVVNNWTQDSTHLVMPSVKVTIKHKRLSSAVVLGGGEAKLLDEGILNTSLLESAGSCVIDVEMANSQMLVSTSLKKWIGSVTQIVQRKGLRLISEAEIGLAAIYMSTDTYCNPLSQMDAETSRTTIPGATLSQSTAVEETIMPAATLNSTAYAPDTEPSQQYTREREENETFDWSQTKQARTEENKKKVPACPTPQVSQTRPTTEKRQTQIQFPLEDSRTKSITMAEHSGMVSTSMIELTRGSGDPSLRVASKKRKEMDELFAETVAGIEDLEDIMSQPMEQDQEEVQSVNKKKRIEPPAEAVKVKQEDVTASEYGIMPAGSMRETAAQTQQKEFEAKEKIQLSLKKESDFGLFQPSGLLVKSDDMDGIPRNLIVTEFKSLVVSMPARPTARSNQANVKNFKRFRKVPFPGAVGLPNIIGGSDLVAHQAKKNSELEEWLRQEAEELSQYAREESIADDLFRYVFQ
ncbi:UNVERIFIED_CONTAM: hypothetical protein FKN15_026090 [Acipenser sinensis]